MLKLDFLISNEECENVLEKASATLPQHLQLKYRLLLEEMFSVMVEEASGAKAQIRIQGAIPKVVLSVCGDRIDLFSNVKWNSDRNEDLQSQIRFNLFVDNADRITQKYSSRKKRNIYILKEPSKAKTTEQRIDEFYSSGEKITPMKQIMFFRELYIFKFFFATAVKAMRSAPLIVIPIITAKLIDLIIDNQANLTNIFFLIGIGLLSLVLNVIGAHFEGTVFKKLIHCIEADIRSAMVRKLQRLSLSYHNNIQTGLITTKIMMDVDRISFIYNTFIGELFQLLAYIVAAAVMTLLECKWMTLFYVLCIPVAVSVSVFFRKAVAYRNSEYRKDQENANAAIEEMLDMINLSRAHGLQKNESTRVNRYLNKIQKSGTELDSLNTLYSSLSYVSLQVFQLVCLLFSALMARGGWISIGSIALFQSYFATILSRLTSLVNHMPEASRGIESFRSVAEILCINDVEHSGATKVNHGMKGRIELKDVGFHYSGKSGFAMKNFSLVIPEKKSIAIFGGSGSGKSTILNLVTGSLEPCSGQVIVDGLDLKELDLNTYRHQIAVVPQTAMLYTGTLYDNLTYGLPYVSRSMVESILEAVDLKDFVNTLPDGLDSIIEEGGANLSGGQRQKISLARALLRRPRILILDEFTNALDRKSEMNIMNCVRRILGTCTILMVSHRVETAKMVDEIIVLRNGSIIDQGSFDELISKEGPFHDMYSKH